MKNKKQNFHITPYIFVAIIFCSIASFFYINNFHEFNISDDPEDWAYFGSYLGGTLTPILAFLSFVALLITIQIQHKELSETSETLKLQNFETTFFNMINLHNEIIKNLLLIKLNKKRMTINGEDRAVYAIGDTAVEVEEDQVYSGKRVLSKLFEILNIFIRDCINSNQSDPKNLYRAFLLEFHEIIDHYFRNIYHILKFIDKDQNLEKKKFYTNILRAQLSNYELALILMNSLYYDDDEKKLFKLLVKYEFMEPLNIVLLTEDDSPIIEQSVYTKIIDKSYYAQVINKCIEETKNIKNENYEDTKIFGSNKFIKKYMNLINPSSQEPQ